MRFVLAISATCLTAALLTGPVPVATARTAVVASKVATRLDKGIAAARAAVAAQKTRKALPAYPDALFALARAYRAGGKLHESHEAAESAASAYDTQLEMHHELSEALADPVHGRAERAAARKLGLARDDARYFAAQVAEQMGDVGLAIPDYVLVARSQPGEGLGLDAMAALKQLGWLASPLPSAGIQP